MIKIVLNVCFVHVYVVLKKIIAHVNRMMLTLITKDV